MFRNLPLWIWIAVAVATAAVPAVIYLTDVPVYEARGGIEMDASRDLPLLGNDNFILKAANQAGLNGDAEFNNPPGNASLIGNARKHMATAVQGSSQLVEVRFTAGDPVKAAAFLNALLDVCADEMRSRSLARSADLTAQIDATESALETSEHTISGFLTTHLPAPAALVAERDHLKQTYDSLVQQAGSIQSSLPFTERAVRPVKPIAHSNPWIGLAAGIPMTVFGIVLFYVSRQRIRQVNKSTNQVEVSQPWAKASRAQIVAVSHMGAQFTSPDTLLDLVETLVAPGRRVLIVDCEFGGALTESVGLTGKRGFSDFLSEEPDYRYFTMPVWKSTREGIFIMPAGTEPYRIGTLLSKPGAGEALALLREEYDQAVINAPAILTAGAMRDLTRLANGIVLITPPERSQALESDAVRQVEEYGGRILAMVDEGAPQFEAV